MNTKELSFEQAVTRLEELISKLERGDAPLEDALSWFEEGTKLAGHCGKLLEKAEQKIVKLTKTPSGTVEELPFESEDVQ